MSVKTRIIFVIILLVNSFSGMAQDGNPQDPKIYDPHQHKIIPDKVFEIGLPLLVLFLLANTLVAIFKIKADSRLREKAIDKGISEPALIALFGEDKKLSTLVYVKWFLILGALGISLLIIQASAAYFFQSPSGYFALGIITIFQSIALLVYYRILKKNR